MGVAIQRYDFILSGVLRVAFYRSLHVVSVPFNINDVHAYSEENSRGEGQFLGNLIEDYSGPLFRVYRWEHVKVGEGLETDFWVFGFQHGAQTVICRSRFWMLNFSVNSVTRNLLVSPQAVT